LIVACNSNQKAFFEAEFPNLRYVDLSGYGVSYSNAKWSTSVSLVLQARKILTKVKAENRWLASFLAQNQVNAVISDNRYGLFSPETPCILITHQLAAQSGLGKLADKVFQRLLYRFINRFTECWVPDFKKNQTLAGSLSHPQKNPSIPTTYIGALSRLERCSEPTAEPAIDVLVLISGPEPQRSAFEKIIFNQLAHQEFQSVVIRGLPANTNTRVDNNLTVHDHLPAKSLNELICRAKLVICRSGYTSIMDLLKLGRNLVVVPTPGQAEQEYLAKWLAQNGYAITMQQKDLSISRAKIAAQSFPFVRFDRDMNEYKLVFKNFVERISSL
jgi:uncharacterized protein (TIGR00661 family)